MMYLASRARYMKPEKCGDNVPGFESEVHEIGEKAGFRPATKVNIIKQPTNPQVC
jgi:hypothetical protein